MNEDEIYEQALDVILEEVYASTIINKDHNKYWSIFNENICLSSVTSLKSGINDFYTNIEQAENKNELFTYHIKLFTRLLSLDKIKKSIRLNYETFKTIIVLKDYIKEIDYDLVSQNEIINISDMDKLILFIYTNKDKIDNYLLKIVADNAIKEKVKK